MKHDCYHDLTLPSKRTPLLSSTARSFPETFNFSRPVKLGLISPASLGVCARAGSSGDKKGQQPASQAEAERQQILNEMKKKTPLLTDSSWIRQRPATTTREVEIPPMRRCDGFRFFATEKKVKFASEVVTDDKERN